MMQIEINFSSWAKQQLYKGGGGSQGKFDQIIKALKSYIMEEQKIIYNCVQLFVLVIQINA